MYIYIIHTHSYIFIFTYFNPYIVLIIRLHIYSGQGIGYAKSTQEELSYIIQVAHSTGIILDPVYSGKALYYFSNDIMRKQKKSFKRNDKILFIHTGGTIGLYDKGSDIVSLLSLSSSSSKVSRMKITKP
jgi:hypothetical protein